MVSLSGADVMVERGAELLVQKNTATTFGGGVGLHGSTLTAGNSTRVTVVSNTAGQHGGGVFSVSGADVMVESGAALVVQEQHATSNFGGGVYLQDEGSILTATGNSTRDCRKQYGRYHRRRILRNRWRRRVDRKWSDARHSEKHVGAISNSKTRYLQRRRSVP